MEYPCHPYLLIESTDSMMTAHSSSFKVVQFVFQNNEKWRRGFEWSQVQQKVENLMSPFWEAILAMKAKFLRVTYVHLGYPQTEISSKSERVMCETLVN